MENTALFDNNTFNDAHIIDTIKKVYTILEERGYDPINQLTGYIMSGDPGYITSYKEARNMVSKIDRSVIIELLLRNYIK